MAEALYGDRGFFTAGAGPAAHFRTSVHVSGEFAPALLRLLGTVDELLGHPDPLDLVDVGAGRGELLSAVLAQAPPDLAARLHPVAVELAGRPADLPAAIDWVATEPRTVTGLLLATEWLDNVPLDVVERDAVGELRYVTVDRDGIESLGGPVDAADSTWLEQWWPLSEPGLRAEVGRARDEAWAAAVSTVERGLAVCIDYGHLRDARPVLGTLTGFRNGRQVPPVPDGSCDLTAHVAMDAVAAAGASAAGGPPQLLSQREALAALGLTGRRPPLERAHRDPAGYLRALAAASRAAELTDAAGLGAHYWLLQPVTIAVELPGDRAAWHDAEL
jgi:SAM-dependent MidA family methyltransferase